MKITRFNTEIVLIDIVRFSERSDEDQWKIIQILDAVIHGDMRLLPTTSVHQNFDYILGFIPTGDGFYAVLHPGVPGYGVFFALGVRSLLLNRQQDHPGLIEGVRVAVNAGTALPFRDVTGKLNFVGTGMNDAARLLSLKDSLLDDAVKFASGQSYAVASEAALMEFHKHYQTHTPAMRTFLQQLKFRASEVNVFKDHHEREHRLHFIETGSRIVCAPPKMRPLAVGTNEQVRQAIEQIMNDGE